MRDLLFKNLTSLPKKRRIIASSEVVHKQGTRSIIHRHFVCILKEVKSNEMNRPRPYLYVLKEHNKKEQKEKFFCRIKGSVYALINKKLFLVLFMHSLKINLEAVPQDLVDYR